MKSLSFLWYVFILILTCGCQDSGSLDIQNDSDFFDPIVGDWWEYQVDSVTVRLGANDQQLVDSARSWMRWEVVDVEYMGEDTVYLLQVERRSEDVENYQSAALWSLRTNGRHWIRQQRQLEFIVMELPIHTFRIWEGNRLLDQSMDYDVGSQSMKPYGDWIYLIGGSVTRDISTGETDVPGRTITHVQRDDIIEYRDVSEFYGTGIGLVTREEWLLDTQCRGIGDGDITLCAGLDWLTKADFGWHCRWDLVAYGRG